MSANIQNYVRPTGSQDRKDINKILEGLQDLFAAPIEEGALQERIALALHRKKKTQTVLSGALIDASNTDVLDLETLTMIRKPPLVVQSYELDHSITGTLTNSVKATKYGGRVDFDGSSNIVISDNNVLDVTDEITITGFFYLPATAGGEDHKGLISKESYSLNIEAHDTAADTIIGSVIIGGTEHTVSTTYTPNTMTHITMTWKSPNLKLYTGTTLQDTNSSATGTLDTNSKALLIGDGYFLDHLLLETGDSLLLETGDKLLLE